MSEFYTCEECGELLKNDEIDICDECKKEEDEDYE